MKSLFPSRIIVSFTPFPFRLNASRTIEPTSERDRSNSAFPHSGQRIDTLSGECFPTAVRVFFMDIGCSASLKINKWMHRRRTAVHPNRILPECVHFGRSACLTTQERNFVKNRGHHGETVCTHSAASQLRAFSQRDSRENVHLISFTLPNTTAWW